MRADTQQMTIGALAKAAGVNVETIRFYQRKGLIPVPDRPYGGIRHYDNADVARLKFIKSAQWLGFSLDEVAELLRLEDGTHCDEAGSLAERKLGEVRKKLADLQQLETALAELVGACHRQKGNVSCPLIASLQGHCFLKQ
ncbi:Hg(II)-responsive transcriptional regulator [Zobellella aerophila]|uniref:Mercuric resistance operon regulatory protein n=1 Tax=Zobellella aerophila TaxID=870480 RepID=A0ABP6VHE6_9GAMM